MNGLFQPYEPDEQHLFPPSPRDWLPEDHLAYFISETVDELDIEVIESAYRQAGAGTLAYHPRMMLKVLIYSYCTGIFSSRSIARGLEENIALRVLAAGNSPSHRTLCRFRCEHIEAFKDLFMQVVRIAQEAKLVKMGTLAIDGTKLKANGSKHKAMSYGRMKAEEAKLGKEITAITKAATEIDAQEDLDLGPNFRGDKLPEELARRQSRKAVIQAAKRRLEARTKEADADAIAKEEKRKSEGKPKRGAKRKRPLGTPKDSAQENFTDPDSRIMKTKTGYEQCYNAQAGVDRECQIIVAATVSNRADDSKELLDVIDVATENTGHKPSRVLADAGYKSEGNFNGLETRGIRGFVALGRKDTATGKGGDKFPATQRMRRTMNSKRGRKTYRMRKHIVEAPFGWIKQVLGFRSFSLRGIDKISGEWSLVCAAINLRRMAKMMQWT